MYDNYTQYYTGFYSLQHNSCNYPFDLILAEFPVKYNEIIAYRDRVGRRDLKFQPGRQKIMNIFFLITLLECFFCLSCYLVHTKGLALCLGPDRCDSVIAVLAYSKYIDQGMQNSQTVRGTRDLRSVEETECPSLTWHTHSRPDAHSWRRMFHTIAHHL